MISQFECNQRIDPVSRRVRDLSASEFVAWLVEYHGLPASSAKTVEDNLLEQYQWHRLQGRLDQHGTAAVIATMLHMRQSPMALIPPKKEGT